MHERLHYLFSQYLENRCSRKELEEFFGYIRRAEHDETVRQLIRQVYDTIHPDSTPVTSVDEKGQLIFNEPTWLKTEAPIEKVQKKTRAIAIVSLAVVAIAIATTTSLWVKPPATRTRTQAVSSLTRKTTDRSESKFILLQDSTKVWLNAASSLEFPDQFNDKKREVYLTGEAFFDVMHADKIPFIIHTGDISTTVLGTAFNIKAYPGQKNIIVSVSRGKVKISRHDALVTTLVKGQQAKIEGKGGGLIERAVPESSIYAWQEGNVIYDDETFGDILSDMERTYNARIDLRNESQRQVILSTSFKKEIGVKQALQVLCKLTDTELKENAGIYIIK